MVGANKRLIKILKRVLTGPATQWYGSVGWKSLYKPKGHGLILGQGICLGCRQDPLLEGTCERQRIDVCLTHKCFLPFFYSSLSISLKSFKRKKENAEKLDVHKASKSSNIYLALYWEGPILLMTFRLHKQEAKAKALWWTACQSVGTLP